MVFLSVCFYHWCISLPSQLSPVLLKVWGGEHGHDRWDATNGHVYGSSGDGTSTL